MMPARAKPRNQAEHQGRMQRAVRWLAMAALAAQLLAPMQGACAQAGAAAPAAPAPAAPAQGEQAPAAQTSAPVPGNSPADAAVPPSSPGGPECKDEYPAGVIVRSAIAMGYRDVQHERNKPAPTDQQRKKDQAAQARTALGAQAEDEKVAQLRHGVKLTVDNLPVLIRLVECDRNKDRNRKIVLFLGNRALPGLTAYPPTNPGDNSIIFRLERTPESLDAWRQILGRPSWSAVPLPVSIGWNDSYPAPSHANVEFEALPQQWFWGWAAFLLFLLVTVYLSARHGHMLRDSGPVPTGKLAMYSLGRVQLIYWTFIVLASFAFIGLVTGDYLHAMNSKVLVLMGVSIGTTLGASIIDSGPSGTTPQPGYVTTGSWLKDILSDGKGISVHRFQMAAWTLTLGIVFIHEVYSNLAMPDLDTTLLALMGISSTAYLGLKITSEDSIAKQAALGGGAQPGGPAAPGGGVLPGGPAPQGGGAQPGGPVAPAGGAQAGGPAAPIGQAPSAVTPQPAGDTGPT